jgi:Gram-negative bacterial TonB protein C-terminal
MIKYFITLGISIIISFSQQIAAQEFIKTDSLSFITAGGLKLKYEILDSICNYSDLIAPKYPLGGEHLGKFLMSASYPPIEDSTDLIEGIVNVSFTIDKDGYAKDILINNSINDFIKQDLTNIIKKLKKFEPAKCNDRSVKIRLYYDLVYKTR